jgi:hypothetical protein
MKPCSFEGGYQCFVDTSVINMEAIGSSKTLITTYKTTQHHNPENHNQNFHHYGNLKFHTTYIPFNSHITHTK